MATSHTRLRVSSDIPTTASGTNPLAGDKFYVVDDHDRARTYPVP